MTHTLILFLSLLVLSTASAQTTTIDIGDEQRLLNASLSAVAATRVYGKQRNGTTHALADVAYCNLSDLRNLAHSDRASLSAGERHLNELQRLRAAVKLPSVECATHSVAGIPVQVAKTDRAIATGL